VDRSARRREIPLIREPETALVGKLHESLARGASERVGPNRIGAAIAVERRGEHFGGTRGADIDEQCDRGRDDAICRQGGDRLTLILAAEPTGSVR